ncbi:MAG: type II toxin-antitoxin system RelE/ParE family toxin [Bacteroidales bacterium]|nr:type II toxin-antitoxin system RelE/ParE family toxin [Bacteroidales bacterium]
MKVIQSRIFERKVKKLSKPQKAQLDEAIREILRNPAVGEQKKGDLKMVFIYKFRINNTLFLLAYAYIPEILELIMLGPHENYYKDLKNYLKK